MRLPGQLPLEQAQAQTGAQALVAELARLRVLVQAAVLELAQMQAQRLMQEPELALGLQLEQEPAVESERVRELVLALACELVLVQVLEQVRQPKPAAVLEQARELRVSRQQELQQHRLPTAAQERPPYPPALPMKAPCWGAPAW